MLVVYKVSTFLAEHLAESFEKNREAQDAYAYESQMKTKTALENNYFTPEIVPVISGSQKIDVDEHPKPATVRDELAKLKTVFKRNVSSYDNLCHIN